MDNTEELQEMRPCAGEVQRRVQEWEIQIIATSAGIGLKNLCQAYFDMEESPEKEQARKEILQFRESRENFRSRRTQMLPEASCTPIQEETVDSSLGTSLTTFQQTESPDFKPCEIDEVQMENPFSGDNKADAGIEESIKREIIRQLQEKNIYSIDTESLEKKPWKETIGYLLDIVKTSHAMPVYVSRKSKQNHAVCFNCEQKGHIVKHCPSKTKKQKKKHF
ncbi:hypothetical protein NEMIN01_0203 [Nematocida minor]|uniref:uncharacterized protein n=1 Tax=Nematocida minor TaxID=1912983 RepID=UPI00221F7C63|nr:uncharacterized protein NEMIN01_0099 [Nematocida minor]XP_051332105.1 uncharacterized protein NEMIN01_0203 [Nematocida minor]KAI5188835.1 hypothetical protein NEMIN01_0099 [Nematocida minor]KAI5188939.1 hypothetical protein NEMIN01_0203 [Nematocida minor]